jgi:hypothetical protein
VYVVSEIQVEVLSDAMTYRGLFDVFLNDNFATTEVADKLLGDSLLEKGFRKVLQELGVVTVLPTGPAMRHVHVDHKASSRRPCSGSIVYDGHTPGPRKRALVCVIVRLDAREAHNLPMMACCTALSSIRSPSAYILPSLVKGSSGNSPPALLSIAAVGSLLW